MYDLSSKYLKPRKTNKTYSRRRPAFPNDSDSAASKPSLDLSSKSG